MATKELAALRHPPEPHWVGDGFPVRSLFSMHEPGNPFDPFLLLDYGGPVTFGPSDEPRGVGEHPHRGFETVTIVFEGDLAHRDSAGHRGRIGPGDVQWMTAGSGVVHEEFHAGPLAEGGGALEMMQLWVNLPAKDKMTVPRYQTILGATVPEVPLSGGGRARLIAGRLGEVTGPAKTFTAVDVWDLRLPPGRVSLPIPDGHTAILVVRSGCLRVAPARETGPAELALFDRSGDAIEVEALGETAALLLAGAPIGEPVVAYGPFVMNTADDIRRAIDDYRDGRMGRLSG